MSKKVLIWIAAILVLVILILLFIELFNKNIKKNDPFIAISGSPSYILEVNDISKFSDFFKNKTILLGDSIFSINTHIDFYNNFTKFLSYSFEEKNRLQSFVIICYIDGNKTNFEGICVIPEKVKDKSVKSRIEQKFKPLSRQFGGHKITEITLNTIKYYFTVIDGLIVFSNSTSVVEQSLKCISKSKSFLKTNKEFENIYNSAGRKEPANIYINPDKFFDLFEDIFSTDFIQNKYHSLRYFSGWIGLDINFTDEKLILNGFLNSNLESAFFTNILKEQDLTDFSSFEIIPDNVSYLLVFSLSNSEVWFDRLLNYRNKIDKKYDSSKVINEFKEKYGINPVDEIFPLIEKEVCLANLNIDGIDPENSDFIVLKTNSSSNSQQTIEAVFSKICSLKSISFAEFISEIEIDTKTKIKIYTSPFENWSELIFGRSFNNISGKYFLFYSNYILISDNKEVLKNIVYKYILNTTLSKKIEFSNFYSDFSQRSLMFAYFDFNEGINIVESILNDNIKSTLTNKLNKIKQFGNWAVQLNKVNNLLYLNIVLRYSDNIIEKPVTVWETRIEGDIIIKPVIVTNHDDQSKEIVIQDEKLNLYLLSSSGRIIWKIKLDEPIQNKIYQVDAFKNGKLQYLFSTKNKIYLIDRLGNYLDRYPIILRSSATSPMSLFDYEGLKDYRIFIACEDKNIYVYNISGTLVKGWQFDKTENIVNTKISHFRVEKDDYIVFKDDYKLYVLSRIGEIKQTFNLSSKFSPKNKVWLFQNSKSKYFVSTDIEGTIRLFGTDGKIDSIKIKDFSENHYFAIYDIDRDGIEDFIFADSSRLEVFNRNRKMILSYIFDSKITYEPLFYSFPSNQIKIGIVCRDINKIFLINSDGSVYNGFPLEGISQFSISFLSADDNKFNLIVAGKSKLLLNYKIKEN